MPTPKKKLVNLPFPLKGFTENTPYGQVPDGFTLDAQNVRVFGMGDRLRGAQRPGTARAIAQQVDGDNPVQRMGQIALASADPSTLNFDDDLNDAGSGVNGDGPGGGWLRFPPDYYEGTDWPEADPELDEPDESGEEPDTVETLEAGTLS